MANLRPHKFCTGKCKGKWKYITGTETTETQYLKISGNWSRYYSRLSNFPKRKGSLSTQDLLAIHEKQDGRCALSGAGMTCTLSKGFVCPTNASIDRIEAGGSYSPSNIQLTCRVVNGFRANTPIPEFIEWCHKVSRHAHLN